MSDLGFFGCMALIALIAVLSVSLFLIVLIAKFGVAFAYETFVDVVGTIWARFR